MPYNTTVLRRSRFASQQMPSSNSAEGVQAQYIAKMPAPLGEYFGSLFNSVSWLNSQWDDYRTLFRTSPATVQLMNDTAGAFFYGLSEMYWEVLVLHICRLTDPAEQGKHKNLTVQTLADVMPGTRDVTFKRSVETAVRECVAKTEFARTWRDKKFAHTDRPLPGGKRATPLPAVDEQSVQQAIDAINKAMNVFEMHYLGGEVGYGLSLQDAGGVMGLTHYLKKGLDAQRDEDAEREGVIA
jgi:hypothetical protein